MRVLGLQPRSAAESLAIPLAALSLSLVLFGLFLSCAKVNPLAVFYDMYQGAFGASSSWQDTLVRAAPLMLTGLCTALPARLGLVIIGGEGAVVLGGLAAAVLAHLMPNSSPWAVIPLMMLAGAVTGGVWIMLSGILRYYRGVSEVIASLLLSYIALAIFHHLVEGPLHDPASLNNPSTWPIGDANAMPTFGTAIAAMFPKFQPWVDGLDAATFTGKLFGFFTGAFNEVHLGLLLGVLACLFAWVLMHHTRFGLSSQIVGGNLRAARIAGLPVGRLLLTACFLGGAGAGLAGALEVAAVHGRANGSLIAGYGYTGILVAFMARHNPLAIIPVALLLGGINASNGLVQRREHLPDATMMVLQGIFFVTILAFETWYGRFKIFQPVEVAHGK